MNNDISKCANDDCTKKEQCLRWTLEPSKYQSFTVFYPNNGECEYFINNKK